MFVKCDKCGEHKPIMCKNFSITQLLLGGDLGWYTDGQSNLCGDCFLECIKLYNAKSV